MVLKIKLLGGVALIKPHKVINQPQCPYRTVLIFVFLGQPAFGIGYKILYPQKISEWQFKNYSSSLLHEKSLKKCGFFLFK